MDAISSSSDLSAPHDRPGRSKRATRFADWQLAIRTILGFWLVYGITVIVRALLGGDPVTVLQNRALTIAGGIIFTFMIYAALALFASGRSARRRAVIAFAASLIAAAAQSALMIGSDKFTQRPKDEFRFQAREGMMVIQKGLEIRIERRAAEPLVFTLPKVNEMSSKDIVRVFLDATVVWLFFFGAWSAFYLAARAQNEALDARRRIAEAEAVARTAQVRALRYQVNPHFLFNTLNSLSSLVLASRSAEAESMILKLSAFFRSSLTLEPTEDVTLADEIALQQHYLDIEMVRFPKRLTVAVDVPAELEHARLPALLLQPLVENAIKYGVSPTREKVVLTIAARRNERGWLELIVTNQTARGTTPTRSKRSTPSAGTGVGLTNVRERLKARFGDGATCRFGPLPDGGFEVRMTMPLEPPLG